MTRKGSICALIAAAGTMTVATTASGDLIGDIFRISVDAGNGPASFAMTATAGFWDGNVYYWELPSPVELRDPSNTLVGTLTQAAVTYVSDPEVHINFTMQASNQNTNILVDSTLLAFNNINQPEGKASAALTITDVNGDGATLTPGNSGAYTSRYNGAAPGGTTFANLLNNPFNAGPISSETVSEEFPGGNNFAPLGGPASDMSARFDFTLSPFDVVSGTSSYIIAPAPGSAALLGLGGLVALRRRR